MPLTLPLPDWVPSWVQLVILAVAILFGFAFLMMPFAVFGVKGRLEFLESRLEDIQGELRMLAMRLSESDRRPARPVEREPVAEEIVPRPQPARPRPQPAPAASVTPSVPLASKFPPDEPRPLPLRRPQGSDDWSQGPLHDDAHDLPRRPLRASGLRDPDGDRSRSEPTLRWPPR